MNLLYCFKSIYKFHLKQPRNNAIFFYNAILTCLQKVPHNTCKKRNFIPQKKFLIFFNLTMNNLRHSRLLAVISSLLRLLKTKIFFWNFIFLIKKHAITCLMNICWARNTVLKSIRDLISKLFMQVLVLNPLTIQNIHLLWHFLNPSLHYYRPISILFTVLWTTVRSFWP